MTSFPWPWMFGLFILELSACQASPQAIARNAELHRPAADEMNRICALKGEERAAELKRLKDLTGLDLYCPD